MITPEPWKFYDQFESSDRNLTHTACSAFHIYKSSYLWKFLGSLCDLLTFNSLLDIFLLNRDFENCVEQKVIPPRNCRQNLISFKAFLDIFNYCTHNLCTHVSNLLHWDIIKHVLENLTRKLIQGLILEAQSFIKDK